MQSDIEIYLLSCPTSKIREWLQKHFIVLTETRINSELYSLVLESKASEHQDQPIQVQILEQAAGKRFTSVWFDSAKTPWQTDTDCARDAYAVLECEVRCNMTSWQEVSNEDPDQWWHINQYEEGPFIWK